MEEIIMPFRIHFFAPHFFAIPALGRDQPILVVASQRPARRGS
jgi:hypothetical protein